MRRRDYFRKTQQKRYASRSYKNPYFRDRIDRRPLIILIGILISFIAAIVLLSVFFSHSSLLVREINVKGRETISKTEIENTIREYMNESVFFIFTKQNRFLFNNEQLTKKLQEKFTFREIKIEKNDNRVDIQLIERTSYLIWQTSDSSFVVDLDGVIIRKAEAQDVSSLPLFVDRNNVEVQIGNVVLSSEEIFSVFRFQEYLRVQKILFVQTEFDRLAGKWTGILTEVGYRILLDATGDIEAQAERLDLVMREKVKDVLSLEYIDLRFGDHVYYK
ncbi:hypothetical protein HY771_03595 [Candidatus Uhrbacteria bacterium]|nr:hypothetical protein [Candidatus Uhrbacteria bacterium]